MNRDTVRAFLLWVGLTVIGEALVVQINLFPAAASRQGEHVDSAIRLLTIYAVPVFTFVLAVLAYSVLSFRSDGPAADGPPIEGSRSFSVGWLAATTALATLLFIYPGMTGLLALEERPEEDLVVEFEAVQWHWNVAYPDQGVTLENPPEVVLPVGRTIRFEITSRDVIHSVWIPAFRLKQDAVPGRTTLLTVTPTETGTFEEDFNLRLQCAELCGTGHARMFAPVRVVEEAEFEEWLAAQAGGQGEMGGMEMGGEPDMEMGDQETEDH